MAKQRIGEGAPFLLSHPGDEIEHQPAGPVARNLHHRVLDDASALVAPGGEDLLVEYRCDHQRAMSRAAPHHQSSVSPRPFDALVCRPFAEPTRFKIKEYASQ